MSNEDEVQIAMVEKAVARIAGTRVCCLRFHCKHNCIDIDFPDPGNKARNNCLFRGVFFLEDGSCEQFEERKNG